VPSVGRRILDRRGEVVSLSDTIKCRFQDTNLWMPWNQKTEVNLEDFDPNGNYSAKELEAYAEAMLKEDIKENGNVNHILFEEHIKTRWRREVPNSTGIADPTLTNLLGNPNRPVDHSGDGQMMFNRTHPRGRKTNSASQRKKNGASYFR